MTGEVDVSALHMVLTGDPALLAIVRLSLIVSLSAVLFAALIGVPIGAFIALIRFPGREAVIVMLNALMGLPPVVVGLAIFLLLSRSGPLGDMGPAVHAAGHGDRANRAGGADHRRAGAADHRRSVGRISRRARRHECRPAAPHRDADLGRALSAWSPRCLPDSAARRRKSAPSSSSAAISTASPAP